MGDLPSGKVQFNWKINGGLKKRFSDICTSKGYQKQAQVERMLKEWIAKEEGTATHQPRTMIFRPSGPVTLSIEGREVQLTELHVQEDETEPKNRPRGASGGK